MKNGIAALLAGSLLLLAPFATGADKLAEDPQALADDQGFVLGLLYRGDVFSNVSGGLKRGTTALGNLDVKLDFDLDRLAGLEGFSAGIQGIASHGGKPNAHYVGSSQGIDNIEVETNTAKILQAWIQKQWQDDKFSVLLGLYDLNSEFYVSHSTGIFLHPAPGIGSELAQTGLNGPSIFPTTSVALRARYRPTPESYLQAVVLDGVPGDPGNARGTHIQFNKGDGSLRVLEAGYVPDRSSEWEQDGLKPTDKYAIGAWSYTSRFADLVEVDGTGEPLLRKGNRGFYVLAERTLYRATGHVDGFIRYGWANADFNQLSSYFQTGVVFTGMVAARSEDQLAFSYSIGRTGDKYRAAASSEGVDAARHESVWEATYRASLTPWLIIQPNFQYVIHPGADLQVRNATVFGLRFELSFEK